MVHKTNAARFLDGKHIPYELVEYEVDESDLSAVHVAAVCGEQIEKIYKTIVCECEPRGYVVACIQGDLSLNLKALARLSGHKKCELLNLRELEKVTGYIRGGCSPFGMKKHFRTFIDEKALTQEKIYVSAGVRGKQIALAPKDLATATEAQICKITHD